MSMKVGHIFTEGIIPPDYADILQFQIDNITRELGPVDRYEHHLSSPGGSVYGGYEGFHKLIGLRIPIDTIIEGQAQSMASFIPLASRKTGGKIKILNPSRVMIHEPRINPDAVGAGKQYVIADDLDRESSGLKKIQDEMAEVYAEATCVKQCKTLDEVKAMMKKETNFKASEAVEFGLADELINTINIEKNLKLKAVALGTSMDNDKNLLEKFGEKIKSVISELTSAPQPPAQTVPPATPPPAAATPKAVDLPLKAGGMIHVESENGDLVGKPVSIEGKPADGAYELEDGRKLVCAGGIVSSVEEAPSAEQVKLAAVQAQLEATAKEKEALEAKINETQAAAKEAEKKLEATAVALGDIEKEFKELQSKTVGNDNPPYKGTNNNPIAMNTRNEDAMKLRVTRSFIAEHMPWLEQTEVFQKKYPGGKYPDGSKFYDYRPNGPEAVSILETNLNYTWNGVLSTEIFFKPTLSTPAIADVFQVDLGAADKKRYHIAPTASKILKPYTGCDQAVTGTALDITSKAIQLKPFQMYESWCKDDFTNQLTGSYNVLAQEWLKTGNESFDPAGTPIDRMIMELLKDGLRRDIWRRISFGDTTSSSADWNQIDGLWQSLIDQSGASNYCVYASKTNFGTGALSATAAYNELVAIFNNSSNLLKQEAIDGGKGKFLVTRSIWQNLYDTYTGTGAVTELAFSAAQKGYGNLTFRGIPVVPITVWDDFLADSTNPLSSTTRHLIAFTIKDNHVLGVQNTADLNKIDSWFEMKDNKRYYRSNMVMGFLGAIHCDLTTISY